MDQELLKLLGGGGVLGVAAALGIKYGISAIERLYNDMQTQHKEQLLESTKREDKLMDYLDKKNETDSRIAATLDNINDRLCVVENCIKKDGE